MHRTSAQLILRGRYGRIRVSVHWPNAGTNGSRLTAAILFTEQWIIGDRCAVCDLEQAPNELVLVPCGRASRGYEQGLDDACRIVEWAVARVPDLGAVSTELRIGGSAKTAHLVRDVLDRVGQAITPTAGTGGQT
jgi:hypothetical protein